MELIRKEAKKMDTKDLEKEVFKLAEEVKGFIGESKANFKILFDEIKHIRDNDLGHLRMRINILLFSVVGGIIAGIIKLLFQ